jgi:hypothetical protein
MARDKNLVWSGFIARALAMLPHPAGDPRSSSGNGLNAQDQREYRHDRESRLGNEELAWAEIRESLDNLR